MKTIDYLDALRAKLGTSSDYSLQKPLCVGKQTISRYRQGFGYFDDAVAIRVAAILDISPEQVIADCHAEREKNEEVKKIWKSIAEKFAATAGCILLGGILLSAPNVSEAAEHLTNNLTTYKL